MPNRPIIVPPGVLTVPTALMAGQRWVTSNLIRFLQGQLQSLGGCLHLTSQTFTGTCRGLRPFFDLSGNTYVGIGTNERLELYNAGTITDITPVRATQDLSTPFTTAASSATVTVTDTITVAAADWVDIVTGCTAGGLFLQGPVQVGAVAAGSWTFTAASAASSSGGSEGAVAQYITAAASHSVEVSLAAYTFVNGQTWDIGVPVVIGGITLAAGAYDVTVSGTVAVIQSPSAAVSSATLSENGGNVRLAYLLETAVEEPGSGSAGFGGGNFGSGPFGQATAVEPFGGFLRQWSLDAWGEDLLACPANGGIYVWVPPIAPNNPATLISQAPAASIGIVVVAPVQQVMAFGCTDPTSGLQDPLLIRFSDTSGGSGYTSWTASATNQAGSFRLAGGNTIVGWDTAGLVVPIWTDLDLWIGQYLGFPLVWGFTKMGRNCGLYSMRAHCALGGVHYWLSQQQFFMFAGNEVEPLPCAVWDYLFDNLDQNFPGAVHMGTDEYFNEFFLFFPNIGSNGVCNYYVKYNVSERAWDYGVMPGARSAWTAQSVAGAPIGADYAGLLQQHDDSTSFDGTPGSTSARTGWIALADGTEFISVQRLLTDLNIQGAGPVEITIYAVDYLDSADAPRVYGPYSVTTSTRYCWVRARGRYISIEVACDTATFWRLGRLEAIMQPDGRR